jgi:hypothetical protein
LKEDTMAKAVIYDRHGNVVDDDVVPEGGTLRVPIPFMDALSAPMQRAFADAALPAVRDGLGNPAGHRTGFVFGPRELTADAATAYSGFKARLADAWRSPSARTRSAPRHGEDDRNDDRESVTDAAAAYADYCTRVANAWRAGG